VREQNRGVATELEEGRSNVADGNREENVQERNLQVVCFNCGEMTHLRSSCKSPRVCFICQQTDHVVDQCPGWNKPPMAAQYYGSANRGLGFYHIDVQPRGNRFRHWSGIDNFWLFTIVEGD
jgi:hypothetical protein